MSLPDKLRYEEGASVAGRRVSGRRMSTEVQSIVDKVVKDRLEVRRNSMKPENRPGLARRISNTVSNGLRRLSNLGDPDRNTLEEDMHLKWYSFEEVAKHDKADDLWVIIHGRIYDVTNYLERHPGGISAIREQGGGDCTELFERIFHSLNARKTLKPFLIGKAWQHNELGDLFESVDGYENEGVGVLPVLMFFLIMSFAFAWYQGLLPDWVIELVATAWKKAPEAAEKSEI